MDGLRLGKFFFMWYGSGFKLYQDLLGFDARYRAKGGMLNESYSYATVDLTLLRRRFNIEVQWV
jgi:hypothetical protein